MPRDVIGAEADRQGEGALTGQARSLTGDEDGVVLTDRVGRPAAGAHLLSTEI